MAMTDALKTYIGEGNIFYNVQVPAPGTTAANGSPQGFLAPTGSNPETGIPLDVLGILPRTNMGLTSGPATLEYKPDFKGMEVEQTNGEVSPRVIKEAVTLKFMAAAATVANIQAAIQTATLTHTVGLTGRPTKDTLHVGGLTFFDPIAICLVSPIGSYTDTQPTPKKHNIFEWVTFYQAMSVSGIKQIYKRNETRLTEITFTGYAVPDRPPGDQLFQIGKDSSSNP